MVNHTRLRRFTRWISTIALLMTTTGCKGEMLVFHPAGPVARTERDIIVLSIYLLFGILIVVFILLWIIVQRFRDKPNNTAPYQPEWSESKWLEVVWWGVPILIVAVLSIATVKTTFALTHPPASKKETTPLTVEVTSLNWKWLFQYPDQNIATVNYCVVPTNRPIQFVLTSKAPMNSFWVPQLGGQEYCMPGMAMRLWLQADKPGTYYGTAANFTGRGFAHMHFNVIAKEQNQFDSWAMNVQSHSPKLTMAGYQQLTQQQNLAPEMSFSSYPPGVFYNSVMQDGGMYSKHDISVLDHPKYN